MDGILLTESYGRGEEFCGAIRFREYSSSE